ncbi:MAG: helix-turn-helix transcriptional regulator [Clostridia bacterium]|nr:helix-turn-helix transcriptional regulator [Clostridia bacterium]
MKQLYDLGALIKSLRKERKITQKKLGEILGVTEGTISKYEANTMTPPFETLRSIASFFNISMDTLCGIKHQGTLSTHGLTEGQTDTLKSLIDIYRIKNTQTGEAATQEQLAVLGKIATELTKKN